MKKIKLSREPIKNLQGEIIVTAGRPLLLRDTIANVLQSAPADKGGSAKAMSIAMKFLEKDTVELPNEDYEYVKKLMKDAGLSNVVDWNLDKLFEKTVTLKDK